MKNHIREAATATAKTPAGYSLREVNQFQIDEKSFEEKDGKHYLVVTLMREGPGNLRDNNFYRKSAIESLAKLIMERPKNFFNHAKQIDDAVGKIKLTDKELNQDDMFAFAAEKANIILRNAASSVSHAHTCMPLS